MAATKINSSRVLSFRTLKEKECRLIDYDFKRPDKFSKEQIRTLFFIHETYSRLSEQALSVALRMPVKMTVGGVDQMTYGEFINSIPDHSLMAIMLMNPLKGSAVMEMDPAVVSAVIDRLYGGSGNEESELSTISAIQRAVMEPFFGRLLSNLGESWQNACPLKPVLGQFETNPQFAQIVPPQEMVINISVEISLGDTSGFVNICLPFLTLEPILNRLTAQYWFSTIRRNKTGLLSTRIIRSVKTDGEVVADAGTMTLKSLGALEKGSLIKLEDYDEKPLVLRLGGKPVMSLRPEGKGNKGLYNFVESSGEEVLTSLFPESEDTSDPLKESIDMLTTKLDRSHRELNERIEKLSGRQDNLDDRALLGIEDGVQTSLSEPFAFLLSSELASLYPMLEKEHRQISAFILSSLDSSRGSILLEMFGQDVQTDLVKRICRIERMAPEVVRLTAAHYEGQFTRISEEPVTEPEGIARVVDLLNNSPRTVERDVINTLDREAPDLAEEIKKRMFVFEDIVLLDEKVIRLIYERADRQDLLLSMKGVEDLVRNYIYDKLGKTEGLELAGALENLGRVRISEVDKAQQRVIGLIRELEENGEVVIARPEDITVE